VHVGTIAIRTGVPVDVDQWGWNCGFYPSSHHALQVQGTAETFEQARADFEAAWKECFCGETIDIAGTAGHVYAAHMGMAYGPKL
jgi:hypothetical protein